MIKESRTRPPSKPKYKPSYGNNINNKLKSANRNKNKQPTNQSSRTYPTASNEKTRNNQFKKNNPTKPPIIVNFKDIVGKNWIWFEESKCPWNESFLFRCGSLSITDLFPLILPPSLTILNHQVFVVVLLIILGLLCQYWFDFRGKTSQPSADCANKISFHQQQVQCVH